MTFDVHLVDGTYELFRYYFARPSHVTSRRPRSMVMEPKLERLSTVVEPRPRRSTALIRATISRGENGLVT